MAPAPVCVLCLNEPVASGEQRPAVNITELGHAGGESQEDLTGIECDREDRCLIHHSTLKSATWELDAHQPLEHLSGSLA
jgi:hypothetical protein